MDKFTRDVFGALSAKDQQVGAQTNAPLIAAPTRPTKTGVAETDPDAEIVVTGIEWSASAAGTFYLQNANGAGGRQSITYYVGPNSGDQAFMFMPMGYGNAVKYTSTGAGTLSLRVSYFVRRRN